MDQMKKAHQLQLSRPPSLRIHDLIAKTAHVRLKETLRVLVALKTVACEYDISLEAILDLSYSAAPPSPEQRRSCEEAYLWLYETGAIEKYLFEVEQLV